METNKTVIISFDTALRKIQNSLKIYQIIDTNIDH